MAWAVTMEAVIMEVVPEVAVAAAMVAVMAAMAVMVRAVTATTDLNRAGRILAEPNGSGIRALAMGSAPSVGWP